jgi:hypothetical protein
LIYCSDTPQGHYSDSSDASWTLYEKAAIGLLRLLLNQARIMEYLGICVEAPNVPVIKDYEELTFLCDLSLYLQLALTRQK